MTTKYAIIIPDGAADEPLEQFDEKTPIEAARTPNMDKISRLGKQGLIRTIPRKMKPGSDVAQMSLLGYDPKRYYTGRAPIEAVARNVKLSLEDWVFRCNLITIADGKMSDHSAGHISTAEAGSLIEELDNQLGNEQMRFHTGVSYRHLAVFRALDFDVQTYPPHDHIGTAMDKLLPRGKNADVLIDLMARSQQIFTGHDINKVRKDLGENQVSSIWLWGQGKRAQMERFEEKFGVRGAAITAVDLVKGLAKLIGFDLIDVPGATGFIDTNYQGKASAAIGALDQYDIVFVHVEAPDEAAHGGNAEMKKKAIELIDEHIVGPVFEALQNQQSWRMLVMPDHPTLTRTCAHSSEPVPFAMAGESISGILHTTFGETNAAKSGFRIDNGFELMEYFLKS
ncbi:MAG: cofactor-independent phosphoglycerate mutase [Woeseiaceae bacterium]|nr:cofactor-independent phosphoglycerate mutase [Woeseiaceae bacterium]